MKSVYGKFTWSEIKSVNKDRVVILPVGALVDHGPYLPLDSDNLIVSRLAEAVIAEIPEETLLLPTIPIGFVEHHKDFPGAIYIQPETLMNFSCAVMIPTLPSFDLKPFYSNCCIPTGRYHRYFVQDLQNKLSGNVSADYLFVR